MKRIFQFLMMLISFSVVIVASASADPTVKGITQKCHPDSCHKVPVVRATVTLEIDADDNGSYETRRTILSSSPGGSYQFTGVGVSVPCRIKAEKSEENWGSAWRYFTSPAENQTIDIDMVEDQYNCPCL